MLQSHLSNGQPNDNGSYSPSEESPNGTGSVNILQELNRLEDLILYGFRVPLTGRTLVDEDKLIEQIDFIRVSLPAIFQEAAMLLQQKDEVLLEAEEYGQQVIEAAQAKRAQILAQSDIIRQVELEAEQLQRQVQQECEAMMQATLTEIDQKRRSCQEELEELRQTAIAQAQNIENGADEYADSVLDGIEQDLKDMLRIITNGRQQLRQDVPPQRHSHPPKKK
ncbi:DivIVA domain-containing protein [Nodularia sphaerocarpa]|uniref:DivIVA domain-containing protein n=1 Tax=Nodularia sphaerocarpa TaxID=137816 RepID=UPI001EFA6D74|nr:DivIVA domain-containing protein [Nodularia sphaerocarpa]MDB9372452.1 DivIVA domain-containing protein [Nodularia sphaerocarpa CS-585]MDB9378523.1 DivIVA domain-containing protein [Nodularia sphaerocarpa CS-585A2]